MPEAAAGADIVITMLPDGPEVETAVLGKDGVLEGARRGTVLVDMSSISPMVRRKSARRARRRASNFWMRR